MTSGPTYGQGFIDLEPRLDAGFLSRINSQLDRAFSNIRLDIDDAPVRNIVRGLGDVERSASDAEGEIADMAARSLDVDTNIRNLAGHLGISEDAARTMARQIISAQDNTALLEDSALRTARAMGLSETEAKKFASAINKVDDKPLQRIDSSLGRIRSSLLTMAGSAIAFFGVRGVLGAATTARDSFIELEESVNAVNVVFGEGAEAIFAFGDTVAESAGLARSEFQQMSTVLGSALQNAGFTADEAAAKTITLTQRAADMASVFNTDVQDAIGAIQAALRGESDPIERFGVSLAAAAVDAEAASLGFSRVGGEFDNTAKIAARLSLIMEQTDRVAGDFANTSDSLANRQRINAAQFENLRAELGEKLLPVFEALVAAGPTLLEGLQDLAPALESLAVSAAELGKSTPGMLDFIDVVRLITDLPRGFGEVIDTVQALGLGVSTTVESLQAAFSGNLLGAVQGFVTGMDEGSEIAQRSLERINTQGLIDDLRSGEDAAASLANHLADVGKKGKIDPKFVRALADIAGTDLETTALSVQTLIENADQLGLEAEDVDALQIAFNGLINEMAPVGNEVNQARRAMEGFADETSRAATGPLQTLGRRAEDAGLSLGDAAFSTDEAAVAFREALTPADELALRIQAIASSSEVAAGLLATTLRPALADAGQAMKDLNKDGEVSVAEFISNLEEMTAAALTFQVNLAAIGELSPELALELKNLGPEAAGIVAKGLAENPGDVQAAADALLGKPEDLSGAIIDIYLGALELVHGDDPAAQERWLAILKETTTIPGAPEQIAGAMQDVLNASFADLGDLDLPRIDEDIIKDIRRWNTAELARETERVLSVGLRNVHVDITDRGREARGTFIAGLSEIRPGEISRLRDSIVRVVDGAIIRQSPPKLFRDIGQEAGAAFWMGVGEAPFDFPNLTMGRLSTASLEADVSGFDGGNQFNVTVNNPIGEPTEDSLQAALIEVAVSPTVNRLVSAGSSR